MTISTITIVYGARLSFDELIRYIAKEVDHPWHKYMMKFFGTASLLNLIVSAQAKEDVEKFEDLLDTLGEVFEDLKELNCPGELKNISHYA